MRIAAILCTLSLLAAAGCGSGKTSHVGDATVTTSSDDKTTTVSVGDKTVTTGSNAVDASKLGAPVYPGATADENGGSLSFSGSEGSSDTAMFKTPDSFDAVYQYYKAQLPAGSEKMKLAMNGSSTASFQTGDPDKDFVSVTVMAKDGEPGTTLTINHTVKVAAPASASPAP